MTPMPAETFRHSTHQISQNCGVLCASLQMHVVLGDHRFGFAGRRPAVRPPAGRRQAIAERADHHEEEIDGRHGQECLPHADRGRRLEIVHQHVGERRADHRAAAKAHDRHAGRHAAPVGKPFDQRGDRRDVAEAKADAADHAGAEPHQPELVDVDADCAEHETACPAACGDHARLARAGTFKPAAPECRRYAEHHEEQRVHPAHAGDVPVACGGEKLIQQLASAHALVAVTPIARDNGSQNTLKP